MAHMQVVSFAIALAVTGTVAAQPLPGADPHPNSLATTMTTNFAAKAAQGDKFERQEGRLAERRASGPHVRMFAREMVIAHSRTTRALEVAIRQAGIVPPPPPALTDGQARMLADLKAAPRDQFDKIYVDQQIQAHKDAAGLFEGYVEGGAPGPVRTAAAKIAPLVRKHLAMVTALQAKPVM